VTVPAVPLPADGPAGQQELALELPRRLFAATPTRLTTWLDCPRRYRFSYLDRPPPPKGPPWAHNSLGSSVHLALAGFWRLEPVRRTAAAAGQLLDNAWLREGFRDDEQSRTWRSRAREMVERYAGRLDPRDEPLGVERTVATRTQVLALSGRVDRLDDRVRGDGGRELVVVDYKTGRRPLTVQDARSSLALALYAVAVARTFRRRCATVELHHVPTGEVVAHQHTPETLLRHLGRAEALGEEASGAEADVRAGLTGTALAERFPARPSSACRWCDFLRACPEGSAQYRPAQPWDALAEG
jgi:putative RecB family exonuclease